MSAISSKMTSAGPSISVVNLSSTVVIASPRPTAWDAYRLYIALRFPTYGRESIKFNMAVRSEHLRFDGNSYTDRTRFPLDKVWRLWSLGLVAAHPYPVRELPRTARKG